MTIGSISILPVNQAMPGQTATDGSIRTAQRTGASSDQKTGSSDAKSDKSGKSTSGGTSKSGNQALTPEQQQEVNRLKTRDAHVKNHEAAHMAAGGTYVRGGARYQYQQGPDGRNYAVGGEVSIDVSPIKGDPQATIRKMETVRRAALAPSDPSAQDRSVAAEATQTEAEAQAKLVQMNATGASGSQPDAKPGASSAAAGTQAATFPHPDEVNSHATADTQSTSAANTRTAAAEIYAAVAPTTTPAIGARINISV